MAGNGESNPLVSDMTDSELLDALVLSVDVFWLLMGAVLVFFMQVGMRPYLAPRFEDQRGLGEIRWGMRSASRSAGGYIKACLFCS